MKDIQRVITIVVGGLILFFAYNFWFGSGIFNGWFRPSVESGSLGAGGADFFAQGLEILFTILSTVGTLGIAISLKLIQYLSSPFETAANEFAKKKPLNGQQEIQHRQTSMPSQQQSEYSRVLIQAVIEGDKDLTIAMAERINGSKYLTLMLDVEFESVGVLDGSPMDTLTPPKPKTTPGGFPIKEGGA